MANKIWPATSLIGGLEGSLDSISGADLTVGDRAVVIQADEDYGGLFYVLETSAGATESVPTTIIPDTSPGDFVWTRTNGSLLLDAQGDGTDSIAIGSGTAEASGGATESLALGHNAQTHDEYTVAVGAGSIATQLQATAIGYNASCHGGYAVSVGAYAEAVAQSAISIGAAASTTGEGGISLGLNTSNNGNNAIVIGANAGCNNPGGVAIGHYAEAGYNGVTIGNNPSNNTSDSVIIGHDNSSVGNGAVLLGGKDNFTTGTSTTLINTIGLSVNNGAHTVIAGVPMVPKYHPDAYVSGPPHYGGLLHGTTSQFYLFGEHVTATSLATFAITPNGPGYFFVDEVGLILMDYHDVTTQPEVWFGAGNSDEVTYRSNIQTTFPLVLNPLQILRWSVTNNVGFQGVHTFKIAVAANAGTFNVRPYFRGFFMQG